MECAAHLDVMKIEELIEDEHYASGWCKREHRWHF